MVLILSQYFWSLNKREARMQTVVIPTPGIVYTVAPNTNEDKIPPSGMMETRIIHPSDEERTASNEPGSKSSQKICGHDSKAAVHRRSLRNLIDLEHFGTEEWNEIYIILHYRHVGDHSGPPSNRMLKKIQTSSDFLTN